MIDQNLVNETISLILPKLDERYQQARSLLVEMVNQEQVWNAEVEIALIDLETVLTVLQRTACPPVCTCDE